MSRCPRCPQLTQNTDQHSEFDKKFAPRVFRFSQLRGKILLQIRLQSCLKPQAGTISVFLPDATAFDASMLSEITEAK